MLLLSSSPSPELSLASAQIPEEESSEQGPYICHGLLDYGNRKAWGYPHPHENLIACPKGWAIYSTHSIGNPSSAPVNETIIYSQCCRLPFDDILLDEHLQVEGECPENFVVTAPVIRPSEEKKAHHMRCTKINIKRYQLSEASESWYWGYNFGHWKHRNRIMKMDIPAAIRYGVGRQQLAVFFYSGCIGYPFGSLFVKKEGKGCYDQYYRQLQFRGAPGDPPRGTPVKMYPDCRDISDPFDPQARCLVE